MTPPAHFFARGVQDFKNPGFYRLRALEKINTQPENNKSKQRMTMKKADFAKFTAALLCCAALTVTTSCSDDDDRQPTLTFTPGTATIAADSTARILVSGGTAPYTATTSDEQTATAAMAGDTLLVTGIKAGRAILTVDDANRLSGRLMVEVQEADSAQSLGRNSKSAIVE